MLVLFLMLRRQTPHTIIPWQCSNTPGEIFTCWQPEALNFGRPLDLSGNYAPPTIVGQEMYTYGQVPWYPQIDSFR